VVPFSRRTAARNSKSNVTGVVTVMKRRISSACSTGCMFVAEKKIIDAKTMHPVPAVVPNVGA
jgi:hypothetical protein